MNKKLLCLLLSVLMLFSVVLTGCGNKEDEDLVVLNADSTKTRTVVMAAITGESTTKEAITLVEEELNKISKTMYKTQIILKLMTEDKYESYIDSTYDALNQAKEEAEKAEKEARKAQIQKKRQQAIEDAKKKVRSKWVTAESQEEETSETQPTMTDEYGRVVLEYPDASENQLDILFITGVDMFYRFYDKDYLLPMDGSIESNAQKDLSKYIYPTFMAAGRISRVQYAIPSNQPLGYYTYFLVDKALADKYNFAVPESVKLEDCEAFLDSVKQNESIAPINEVPDMQGLYYLTGEESPIGSIVSESYQSSLDVKPENLFLNDTYVSFRALKQKLINGNYIDANADKSAIKVVRAFQTTPEDLNWSDNYYVALYSKPRASNDTLYSGMYAISSFSENPDRALEIINLLNTDRTFRNAYQYGVQGVHYTTYQETIGEKTYTKARMLNDDYSMNLFQTGNVYMAYVPEELPGNAWERSKIENLSTREEPYFHVSTAVLSDSPAGIDKRLERYNGYVEEFNKQLAQSADPAATLRELTQQNTNRGFFQDMISRDTKDSLVQFYYSYFNAPEDVSYIAANEETEE